MKPNDIATYMSRAKAIIQGIILALLVIVIEETTEYFAFEAWPAGQTPNRFEWAFLIGMLG